MRVEIVVQRKYVTTEEMERFSKLGVTFTDAAEKLPFKAYEYEMNRNKEIWRPVESEVTFTWRSINEFKDLLKEYGPYQVDFPHNSEYALRIIFS